MVRRDGNDLMVSPVAGPMRGENKERWKVLCEQAAVEQDPEKQHKFIKEINNLLEIKEAR
jgi:hypothetical protein